MKFFTHKKLFFLLIFSILIFVVYRNFFPKIRSFAPEQNFFKIITLKEDELIYTLSTQEKTVANFLEKNRIILGEFDQIIPEKDTPIFSGSQIELRRALKVNFAVDGKNIPGYALARNIRDVISENNIALSRLDQVVPSLNSLPADNLKIVITRINVEEKTETETIPFKIIEKTDAKLSWREKKIEQKGEKGRREIRYKITYKNGKEISRVILEKKNIQEPVAKIIVQGTFVKTGKAHKGLGTWYAWKGGLFAANPWLPLGSYVKVTNLGNGKSVIVQINDRGPFGSNRIIDLDKVAFAKIASIGAGVINVKMEEILN